MFRSCGEARAGGRSARGRVRFLTPFVIAVAVAAAAVAVGCQGGKQAPPERRERITGANRVGPTAEEPRVGSIDDVFGAPGSSADRLHELSGPLLAYYAGARRLPETLEELQPVPGAGEKLDFTSPASGRPLVYTPGAVPPPGEERRLVLYDPTPTARRTYWAILMGYPRGNQAAATWVVELPEQALRSYAAATTQPAANAP